MKGKSILMTGLIVFLTVFCYPNAFAQQCDIYIDSQQAQSNSTVTFCVHIEQAPNLVDAFGFDVFYESNILTYTGNWLVGDLTSGFQFLNVNPPSAGQIRVGGFTTENMIQQGASGTVVCLEFTVGECQNTTLALENLVDDIFGWARCNGELLCEPGELTQINLQSPVDTAALPSPPTFAWTANGGSNNAFAVDLAGSPAGPIYSTYENLHLVIRETSWTMPQPMWNLVPSGAHVYWRVRGVDLDHAPLAVVYSDEVWSFYKE